MMKIELSDKNCIEKLAHIIFPVNSIISLTRLGGLTNRSYCVLMDDGKRYVFRLPGEGTEKLINRQHEKINTILASGLGIDTDLLYFYDETGIKISKYIENAHTMSPKSMREDENILAAADLIKTLHNCGYNTGASFEVFKMAEGYEKFIKANNGSLYEDYCDIRNQVKQIKIKTDEIFFHLVPSHNDPLCENWIRDDSRMYLIDWEYAGMNDPFWDLADVSIEAEMNDDMDTKLLTRYLGHEPMKGEKFRFNANKIYIDFLWSLWGKTRVPFDGYSMEQYASERYIRLKQNLFMVLV